MTWALESLKNFHFNGLLLSKVYIVWAKKVQRSYLSWHWRVMQNLKKNWLVVWKMTWEIWQIFTRAFERVKIGTFAQIRKCKTLNFTEELCTYVPWQWKIMQNLKRNWLFISILTLGIWGILTRVLENLKKLHFNWLLDQCIYVWAKKSIEELCLMALKIDSKFEGKLTLAFKNGMRNFANLHRLKLINSTFDKTFYTCLTESLFVDLSYK